MVKITRTVTARPVTKAIALRLKKEEEKFYKGRKFKHGSYRGTKLIKRKKGWSVVNVFIDRRR